MANYSEVNFSGEAKMSNTEGDIAIVLNIQLKITCIITIIINSIACPFTVALNLLVIMAVKTRVRLQTNSNILLACLAATDAYTGLIVQPSFITWMMSLLLGHGLIKSEGLIPDFHTALLYVGLNSSGLHLMLVTFERLLAIKFTLRYTNVITEKNIKIAVTVFWIIALGSGVPRLLRIKLGGHILSFGGLSCIWFIVFSYMILYRETRRHQKMIKTQQLPQEEVERFTKESKALKTTVFIIGAVFVCFPPGIAYPYLLSTKLIISRSSILILSLWIPTFAMLNSLLNPLIYCWRQKEIRKFVFRMRSQVIHPAAANQ